MRLSGWWVHRPCSCVQLDQEIGGVARPVANPRQRQLCRVMYEAATIRDVVTPVFPRMEPCFAVALSSVA
jgi:hypothetical protein